MKALLGRHVPQTRQLLRKIIDGRIVCTPFDDNRGRGYALSATGTYAGLLGDLGMVNNGGGGQAIQPSLAPLLSFQISGIALVA